MREPRRVVSEQWSKHREVRACTTPQGWVPGDGRQTPHKPMGAGSQSDLRNAELDCLHVYCSVAQLVLVCLHMLCMLHAACCCMLLLLLLLLLLLPACCSSLLRLLRLLLAVEYCQLELRMQPLGRNTPTEGQVGRVSTITSPRLSPSNFGTTRKSARTSYGCKRTNTT